eukprot:3355925-Rhodomonas_salina.2
MPWSGTALMYHPTALLCDVRLWCAAFARAMRRAVLTSCMVLCAYGATKFRKPARMQETVIEGMDKIAVLMVRAADKKAVWMETIAVFVLCRG